MQRSSTTKLAALALCFVAGVAIVLLALGGGDDKPATAIPTFTAALPPVEQTTPTTSTTTTKHKTPTKTTTRAGPAPSGGLEVSPTEIAKRSHANVIKAKRAGARSCPDIGTPAAGAIDVTAKGITCAGVRKVAYATSPKGRLGFKCDIVSESFAKVPTVVYSCKRRSDAAAFGYTAVG